MDFTPDYSIKAWFNTYLSLLNMSDSIRYSPLYQLSSHLGKFLIRPNVLYFHYNQFILVSQSVILLSLIFTSFSQWQRQYFRELIQ